MSKSKISLMSYEEAVQMVELSEKEQASDVAFVKLCRIIKALNNGWVPDFSDWNQNKYWIYSNYLYSVYFGGSASYGAAAGFGFSYSANTRRRLRMRISVLDSA